MLRIFRLCLLVICGLPLCAWGDSTNEAIVRATAAIQAAVPRAQTDPIRPIFHVASPAQWMNDPNGPIFYKGYYHLFYQLNPFRDESGPRALRYWGHVRSRDLVKWEPLPIALWPSGELGEESIWSGCCTLNDLGQPMCFYTSIGVGKSAFDQAVQWAAVGDDLIQWHKSPANPVLTDALNDRKIYDWRDPFIFRDHQKTFLVTGGHMARDRGAAVNIYEAENPELTQWKHRGVMFEHPDADAPTVECPNFFKLGDQWVLFVSPYGKVQYFIGDFNAQTCRFTARTRGVLDWGSSFYAPNTMQVSDGRRLVWGWLNGFPGGLGWNGCLSLPRQLGLGRDGQLRQNPAPQLSKLRGKKVGWKDVQMSNGSEKLTLPKTNTLEIQAEIDMQSANRIELGISSGVKDAPVIAVTFDGAELQVVDAKAPLLLAKGERKLTLRIFIDRSVLEVFANETVCVTKIIAPLDANPTLTIRADGGPAVAKQMQSWPMHTIW
ncbi:MAG TPA: glycoside hydrolase family 32 protein [Candidatus Sulfotelmatobacter sp.]|jgi:beta-fructofuranosidase|nr:glycoside hydrolase family 32 protein [Candidatus Sulfotelmatobacter sp.]